TDGQFLAERCLRGGIVVMDVIADLGGELNVLGKLAGVGSLVGGVVNGFLEGNISRSLDPRGLLGLEPVAMDLLAPGAVIDAHGQADGQGARAEDGEVAAELLPVFTPRVHGTHLSPLL